MSDKKSFSFRPELFARDIQNSDQNSGQKSDLPPVHQWNPDFCGDSDMTITRDGRWLYRGSPIDRPAMVRLFSTILRHDTDGQFYLVTPVEKARITVEDAPFIATEMRVEGTGLDQNLHFKTNVGDGMVLDRGHPLRLGQAAGGSPVPYILVRDRLEARISRPIYYELAALAVEKDAHYGLWSAGHFFPLTAQDDRGKG